MPMSLRDVLMSPLWCAALFTSAKSFRDNRVLGSPRLNAWGLHAQRLRLAHGLAEQRRARLAALVQPEDRAAFARDGFVIRHDALPADQFAALRDSLLAHRAPAREMLQGDTVTRRIALDTELLDAQPALKDFLRSPLWHGLSRYVGSFDQEPVAYIQTILSHVVAAPPDPQTHLHADTFHPTVKAWYFLTDVAADAGPFCYVPGSHRLSPERLAWERAKSLVAAQDADILTGRGSFRIRRDELAGLNLPEPRLFAVPANTLVVADTFGFHARGPSLQPSTRIEIWGYGRRNPFLPWAGADLLSLPGLAERRVGWYWQALDWRERHFGKRSPWRDVGLVTPGEPAVLTRA